MYVMYNFKIERCLREGFEDSPVDVQDDAEGLEDQPLQRLLRGLVLSKWEIIKGNTIGRSIYQSRYCDLACHENGMVYLMEIQE